MCSRKWWGSLWKFWLRCWRSSASCWSIRCRCWRRPGGAGGVRRWRGGRGVCGNRRLNARVGEEGPDRERIVRRVDVTHKLVDAEPVRRDVAVLQQCALGNELELGQEVLQVVEVAHRARIEQEAVGRGPLAVGDRVRVGERQQRVREHLELGDRDAAVELAVGRVVEEVEPALECAGLVRLLAEDRGQGGGRRARCHRGAGPSRRPRAGPSPRQLSTKFCTSWAVMMPLWFVSMSWKSLCWSRYWIASVPSIAAMALPTSTRA